MQDMGVDQADYPIPREAAALTGLDYLALGHWHSYLPVPSADGGLRVAYSGTHETTKFGERESGQSLLVEIAARGAAPKITSIPTGGLRWEQWQEVLRNEGDVTRVRERVEQIAEPQATLLELTLSGLFSPRDEAELLRVEELVAARLCYGRVDRTSLVPSPEDESWILDLPEGTLRETAQRIRQQLAGPTRETASTALLELYRLVRETH